MSDVNEPHKKRPVNILVVEDDEDDYQFFMEACKKIDKPINTTHLSDGRKMMETLRKDTFDVLFLDLRMPAISGLDCLKELKTHKEFDSLPVVVLTGADRPEDRKESLSLGAKIFLIKPFSLNKLAEMISMVLFPASIETHS